MNTIETLHKHGFTFTKRYGQNFLTDMNLLRAVVADAGIEKTDDVLEVGCGAGTLTRALAEAAGRVTGYEIDGSLKPVLDETLCGHKNVEIRYADVMQVPDGELFPATPYKVVANLPYYITTPVLFRFVEAARCPVSITVTVQKEVADRLCAAPNTPEYGAVTAAINVSYAARRTRNIPRTLFTPQPNVDSAVVRLDYAPKCDDAAAVRKLIKAAFHMRRKTLVNNLTANGYDKTAVLAALERLNYPADVRGERLSAKEFIALSFFFAEKEGARKS